MTSVKSFYAVAALAAVVVSGNGMADDLTPAKAEELLQPVMLKNCGAYYTEQGDPEFADLDNKYICTYKPKVSRVTMGSGTASVDYTHDRYFDSALSAAWLKDCAKMEAEGPLSLLYKKLKSNLQGWLSSGGVDKNYKPAKATFKLTTAGWQVDSAPQT